MTDPLEERIARQVAAAWGMDLDGDDEALEAITKTKAFRERLLQERVRLAVAEASTPLFAAAWRLNRAVVRWQDRIRRYGRAR